LEFVHLGVIKIFPIRRCDGERVPVAAGAALSGARSVQLFAQRLEQQGEILSVLGAVLDAGDTLSRLFPVDIDPVQRVFANQLDGTIREGGA
jgi:hypothetical protein